jgi:transcription antitermination protein NusB
VTVSKIHPRRHARESVLKALYALNYLEESPKEVLTKILNIPESYEEENDATYIELLYNSVLKHTEKADSLIKNNLQNWDFKRIAELDKILLRMGVTEILFIDEVPPKASITEMVEISKVYSTEESPKFINGILDSVYNNYMKHKKS